MRSKDIFKQLVPGVVISLVLAFIINVLVGDFNSLLIVAIVAIQGVYNNVNIKKLNAFLVVNNFLKLLFVKILSVLITVSFAVIPEIRDVTILQSLNPRGEKYLDKYFPIKNSRLFSLFFTTLKLLSKVSKNHIRIEEIKIIEKAFSKKSFALSLISKNMFFIDGSL